jgi:hypothetical protein
MGINEVLKRKNIQPRDLGHIGLEKVNEVLDEAASIDDRIVTNPEPDEQEPKPQNKEGIVSVNGEDVDRIPPEEDEDKRPAA